MAKSRIEWTDEVWNPVTGCTKVSQGCKHCYAETIAGRFWATQYEPNPDGSARRFTDVRVHPERLQEPLRWKKPRRVFVNSMSDLFHETIIEEFIDQVFEVMAKAEQHTFIILTKRALRMYWSMNHRYRFKHDFYLPNVWLGVSVEDQKAANERVPVLLDTPAAVRFVSCEPLLGPVDLRWIPVLCSGNDNYSLNALTGEMFDQIDRSLWTNKLNWVIVGGESGTGARPMKFEWARSLQMQCQEAGTAFFMKQIGSWWAEKLGVRGKGGDMEFWAEDLRVREFPPSPQPSPLQGEGE